MYEAQKRKNRRGAIAHAKRMNSIVDTMEEDLGIPREAARDWAAENYNDIRRYARVHKLDFAEAARAFWHDDATGSYE